MTEFTPEWIAAQRAYVVENGCLNDQLCLEILDHIERQAKCIAELEQERVEELEAVNEDQALTISQNDYAYAVDKEMMEAEIKASNDLLRSAFMIAKRDGKETNWEAWHNQLSVALTRQHKMMYGKDEK